MQQNSEPVSVFWSSRSFLSSKEACIDWFKFDSHQIINRKSVFTRMNNPSVSNSYLHLFSPSSRQVLVLCSFSVVLWSLEQLGPAGRTDDPDLVPRPGPAVSTWFLAACSVVVGCWLAVKRTRCSVLWAGVSTVNTRPPHSVCRLVSRAAETVWQRGATREDEGTREEQQETRRAEEVGVFTGRTAAHHGLDQIWRSVID